jgi:hypothetical protein
VERAQKNLDNEMNAGIGFATTKKSREESETRAEERFETLDVSSEPSAYNLFDSR